MNPAQYATAITDELRGWAYDWLEGFRAGREQQAVLNLPVPHSNYPLPAEFPFGDFSLSSSFEWIHEYGAEQIRHTPSVDFIFHGRTDGPGSSVAWKLVTANQVDLGVFEVAGRVYDDVARPFQFNADLVLEGMLASLRMRMPVRLGRRDTTVPNSQANSLPHSVQVFEMRMANQVVLRQLGVKWLS